MGVQNKNQFVPKYLYSNENKSKYLYFNKNISITKILKIKIYIEIIETKKCKKINEHSLKSASRSFVFFFPFPLKTGYLLPPGSSLLTRWLNPVGQRSLKIEIL